MERNRALLNQAKTSTTQGNQRSGETGLGIKENLSLGSQEAKTQSTTASFVTDNSSPTQNPQQGKIQVKLSKTIVSEWNLYAAS